MILKAARVYHCRLVLETTIAIQHAAGTPAKVISEIGVETYFSVFSENSRFCFFASGGTHLSFCETDVENQPLQRNS